MLVSSIGCSERASQPAAPSWEPVLGREYWRPTPRQFSEVTIHGNSTITQADYAAIQVAVNEFCRTHADCSRVIFDIFVEDQTQVIVVTGLPMGYGYTFDFKKDGDHWTILNAWWRVH